MPRLNVLSLNIIKEIYEKNNAEFGRFFEKYVLKFKCFRFLHDILSG